MRGGCGIFVVPNVFRQTGSASRSLFNVERVVALGRAAESTIATAEIVVDASFTETRVEKMSAADQTPKRKLRELPPPDVYDPVIEVYMRDVDRTLLRENLKLTPSQRAEKFTRGMRLVFELRRANQARRNSTP